LQKVMAASLVFIQRPTQTTYWVFQSDLTCGYCS
jgi:hypothetical protein